MDTLFDKNHFEKHTANCLRIVQISQQHGVVMSIKCAYLVWRRLSHAFASRWLEMPSCDNHVWAMIQGKCDADLEPLIAEFEEQITTLQS